MFRQTCSDFEGISNALLVPTRNFKALAAAMKQLVEDVYLRQLLAGNARRFAEKNYNWDRCVVSHESVYGGDPFSD